jgi:acetylglutamate/LysW-gamma-L-alpha-aminoadipate kinase
MNIIKIGGGAAINLAGIVRGLGRLNGPTIIVHGANADRDDLATRLGVEKVILESVKGYQSVQSDETTIDLLCMAYAGLKNKRLVELCRQNGINAIGLSGIDGGLITGRRNRGIKVMENGRKRLVRDLSGKPVSINKPLLDSLLEQGYLPVLSVPIADETCTAINTENDEIVRLLQETYSASTVIQFIEAPGILRDAADPESVIDRLDAETCAVWETRLQGRMKRKMRALHKLLVNGQALVWIVDGRGDDPVSDALAGRGTLACNTGVPHE